MSNIPRVSKVAKITRPRKDAKSSRKNTSTRLTIDLPMPEATNQTTVLSETDEHNPPFTPVVPTTQSAFIYSRSVGKLAYHTDIPVPQPKAGEVLLRIESAGLCHSDLHILDGEIPCGDNYVMGHEIAGTICSINSTPLVTTTSNVTGTDPVTATATATAAANMEQKPKFEVGDRVAVLGTNHCTSCASCRANSANTCPNAMMKWIGLGSDGGFQQYLLISNPSRDLVRIPQDVSFDVAAIATDAVLSPYHALKMTGAKPGMKVLIIGCGGLGINAVQLAKNMQLKVTVLDGKQEAREQAKKYGADFVCSNGKEIESLNWSREYSQGNKVEEVHAEKDQVVQFDVCLDFVSKQETFDICQQLIKPRGCIVAVGLASSELKINLLSINLREVRVLGSFWGTSPELEEVFALISKGAVKPVVASASLEELPSYIDLLRDNKLKGRVVFHP